LLYFLFSKNANKVYTCRCTGYGHFTNLPFDLSRSESKFHTIFKCKADYVLKLDKHWEQRVLEITDGKSVDVVFDSVGSTLSGSISVAKVRGSIVFFGMSGGDPQPVDPAALRQGSKQLIGGDLWSFFNSSEQRIKRSTELFNLISQGELKVKKPVI